MRPLVAIQVIAYWRPDAHDDLEACRRSIEALDYPKDRLRVVMVDNPSPHGSALPYLQEVWMPRAGKELPEITLVPQENNTGFAGGHEHGLAAARTLDADFLYLLNQDAYFDPRAITEAVAYAEAHPNAALIQSRVMLAQEPDKLNSLGNALQLFGFGYAIGEGQTPEEAAKDTTPVFYASGAAVMVRLAALPTIGGMFDPRYFLYHEDTDLSWRVRLAGFDIGYADRSVAYHRYEFKRSITKFYWMERNRWVVMCSNLKAGTLALLLPPMILMEAATFVFAARSGWGKEKLRVWGFLLRPSTWAWVRERRALQRRVRRVPDRDLLRLMAHTVGSPSITTSLQRRLVDPLLLAFKRFILFVVRW